MAGISGKHIAAKVGAMPVALVGVQEWTGEESSDSVDGAAAEHEGYDADDFGLQRVSVSMQLVIDISTGQYTPIRAGTEITDLGLYADINATDPIFDIPVFRVFKSTFMGRVREKVTVQVEGKSYGAYTVNDPN